MEELQLILGYQFKNLGFLKQALIHTSYAHENPDDEIKDNERMEFLGDAVLDLIISKLSFDLFPDYKEGLLSVIRANHVNENALSKIAFELSLGRFIKLGKGEEKSLGYCKSSILSSTLEAIIGAIYLDGGFGAAYLFVAHNFEHLLIENKHKSSDYKSQLQVIVQNNHKKLPKYHLIKTYGPEHSKVFEVEVHVGNKIYPFASGNSRKEAEQKAAQIALTIEEFS
jgi:ribonuclease-3